MLRDKSTYFLIWLILKPQYFQRRKGDTQFRISRFVSTTLFLFANKLQCKRTANARGCCRCCYFFLQKKFLSVKWRSVYEKSNNNLISIGFIWLETDFSIYDGNECCALGGKLTSFLRNSSGALRRALSISLSHCCALHFHLQIDAIANAFAIGAATQTYRKWSMVMHSLFAQIFSCHANISVDFIKIFRDIVLNSHWNAI